jgi:ABC-type sugar transport system permease subunit
MKRKQFLIFVAPSVLIMLLLMVLPLGTAIWLGFHRMNFTNINAPEFIGFQNYLEVLQDSRFWSALQFTAFYIVVTVPVQIVLGMVIALLLDRVTFLRGIYIAAALLPFIVTPVVGTLMFRMVFERGGLYTYLLSELMNQRVNFFLDTYTVRFLVVFHGIWYVTPFAMIVLFAGLQTLPKEPIEAATVDGATWFQRLRFVVIPHLTPLIVFIALITIMDAYRIFDSIFVLTKQNPLYGVESIMYYNYRVALSFQQLGKANAMSVLTVIGIFVVLIPFLYVTYRQQREER